MDSTKTRFEDLPDEILLFTYRYLRPCDLIWALYGLNYRLDCTISHTFDTFTITSKYISPEVEIAQVVQPIGQYVRSLTLKSSTLTNDEFQLMPYLEELNYIYSQLHPVPNLEHLTDLNIIPMRSFPIGDILFSTTTKSLHSVYIAPSSPLVVPQPSPPQYSHLQQLSLPLATIEDFYRLLPLCPRLTCLAVTLPNFNPPANTDEARAILPTDTPTDLRTFSFQTYSTVQPMFNSIKHVLELLTPELEHLYVDVTTGDRRCFDGAVWHECLARCFPRLISFEFFLWYQPFLPSEGHEYRAKDALATFTDAFWSNVVPQQINGYNMLRGFAIHSNLIPKVNRRRYFYN